MWKKWWIKRNRRRSLNEKLFISENVKYLSKKIHFYEKTEIYIYIDIFEKCIFVENIVFEKIWRIQKNNFNEALKILMKLEKLKMVKNFKKVSFYREMLFLKNVKNF